MACRTGRDPLAVDLYLGGDLPERRTWGNPVPTEHLFYAPVAPGARNVRVEAVNSRGETFLARVPAPSQE